MFSTQQTLNKFLFKSLQMKLPVKPGTFSMLSNTDYVTAIFIYNNLSFIRQYYVVY